MTYVTYLMTYVTYLMTYVAYLMTYVTYLMALKYHVTYSAHIGDIGTQWYSN